MPGKNITEVTSSVYSALEPLSSDERHRVLRAVLALLGETIVQDNGSRSIDGPAADKSVLEAAALPGPDASPVHESAMRWMRQNSVEREALDQLFHVEGEYVELIAPEVTGKTRKDRTINCYLLVGVRALLATGHATFSDKEAIAFCHQTDAYDKNNHTTNRRALGNRLSGDRASGFTLTVPGLRDAAKLVKQMANGDA